MKAFLEKSIVDEYGVSENAKNSALQYVAQLANLNQMELAMIGGSLDTPVTNTQYDNTWHSIPFDGGNFLEQSDPDLFEWDNSTATLTIKSYRGNGIFIIFAEDVYGTNLSSPDQISTRAYITTADGQSSRAMVTSTAAYAYRTSLCGIGYSNVFSNDEHIANLQYPTIEFQQYMPINSKFVAPKIFVLMLK